jgi:hypothetical protein
LARRDGEAIRVVYAAVSRVSSRIMPLRVAAFAAYCVFWLAVLFGYLRIDQHDVSDALFQTIRGAAVVLPAFVLGLVVRRWWALLGGLVFLLAAVLPERVVVDGGSVDAVLLGNYGVSIGRALALIALTTPCVIAGLMAGGMTRPAAVADDELAET